MRRIDRRLSELAEPPHGLSLAELARRADLSEAKLRHWRNGRGRPDVTEVVQLAAALGFTPHELIYEDHVSEASPLPDAVKVQVAKLAERISRLVLPKPVRSEG